MTSQVSLKERGRGGLDADKKEGSMTTEVETGVTGPRGKESQQRREAAEEQTFPQSLRRQHSPLDALIWAR